MKLITRDTDYAIRTLSCIVSSAGTGVIVTVSELAVKLDMPRAYLRKILQQLSKEGILGSIRGKNGGFLCGKDADKVTVLDLIEIFQGQFQLSEHIFKGKTCPEVKACLLKKKLDNLEEHIRKELSSITIRSIIRREGDPA